jgi:hypothetical protein
VPSYFVEPLGDEGWLDGGELGDDGELDGYGDAGGVVEGDADGVRSPGRSPTRSLRDSPHPAIKVAPAARAMAALSKLFILGSSSGIWNVRAETCNRGATQ